MVIERKNYIVDYDEKDKYISDIIEYLDNKSNEILDFFELKELKRQRKIVIYNDIEKYKKHMGKYSKYYDYMCADTNDGNINTLSLEEAHKTKTHADMTIDDLKRVIAHEFVHICQQDCEIEPIEETIGWFWEALATNLGNPEGRNKIEIEATNNDIINFNSLPNNYLIAFTIGNYMLQIYSHDQILDYIKYPQKLLNDSDEILNNAREWSKKIKAK